LNALLITFFQRGLKVYYWVISPLLGNRCRFVPSCSEYAHQALENHGFIKGLGLTINRLGRCHPWGGSGFDPIPGSDAKQEVNWQKCCSKVAQISESTTTN